jgi:uncharacterized protein YfiM (DUF2279 family)
VKKIFFWLFFLCGSCTLAQETGSPPDSSGSIRMPTAREYRQRKWTVGSLSLATYGGSLLLLQRAWYRQYERTSFHTFNDSREWLQTDKVGHTWSVYQTARASAALWRWAGLPQKKAAWVGAASGFAYLTVVELLDAHSARWGWSWSDMAANGAGSLLMAVQESAWGEQRLQLKFSAHVKQYGSELRPRADGLFGKTIPERLLKDYNAQTYWLSVPLHTMTPSAKIPRWLSMAIGYGAEGVFGGFENRAYDAQGNVVFDRRDLRRQRQWFLSPDIDLTKIRTRSKWVRSLLFAANCLKMPAPALELTGGRIKGRWLYF